MEEKLYPDGVQTKHAFRQEMGSGSKCAHMGQGTQVKPWGVLPQVTPLFEKRFLTGWCTPNCMVCFPHLQAKQQFRTRPKKAQIRFMKIIFKERESKKFLKSDIFDSPLSSFIPYPISKPCTLVISSNKDTLYSAPQTVFIPSTGLL